MDIRGIRALLAGDKATVGTWMQLPSTDVAEVLARAGYDWVAADPSCRTSSVPLKTAEPRLSPACRKPQKRLSKPPLRPARRGLSFP